MDKKRSCVWIYLALLAVVTGCGSLSQSPPVTVSVRNSLVNRGKVLIITNTSDNHLRQLEVAVSANSSNGLAGTTVVVAASLSPHKSIEVGWLELGNRELGVGDDVVLNCRGYALGFSVKVQEISSPRQAAK